MSRVSRREEVRPARSSLREADHQTFRLPLRLQKVNFGAECEGPSDFKVADMRGVGPHRRAALWERGKV